MAKELLSLEKGNPKRLDMLQFEIDELRQLWSELKHTVALVDRVKKTLITTLEPRKIKASLDEIADKL